VPGGRRRGPKAPSHGCILFTSRLHRVRAPAAGPLLEKLEEPPRSNDFGPQSLSPPLQFAICGDECDRLSGGIRRHVDEHVVAAARCVQDCHAVGHTDRDALAGFAFEDHHDRFGDPSRINSPSYLVHERSGCSRPVAPPAGRTRTDHICRINEEHRSILVVETRAVKRITL
jgi:hypothetical protein